MRPEPSYREREPAEVRYIRRGDVVRAGAAAVELRFVTFPTPWGTFGVVARGDRLAAAYLPDRQSRTLERIGYDWPGATSKDDLLPEFRRQVGEYFDGRRTAFSVTLDLSGVSSFHRAVYRACQAIPFGTTVSYAELAKAAGWPGAYRAVGQAMSRNPIPLVIPCHRVVASDGTIGGFSSSRGVTQKLRLLAHEGVEVPPPPGRPRVRAPGKSGEPRLALNRMGRR